MKKPLLIAEIGINHNGDLELAKTYITGQKTNFDCVKFQKRDIHLVYTKEYLAEKETAHGEILNYIKKKDLSLERKNMMKSIDFVRKIK